MLSAGREHLRSPRHASVCFVLNFGRIKKRSLQDAWTFLLSENFEFQLEFFDNKQEFLV